MSKRVLSEYEKNVFNIYRLIHNKSKIIFMTKFELVIPKDFIMFPYNQHYSQLEKPLTILVNYRVVFGEHIEVLSLELPMGAMEMLNIGQHLNNFIQDAAFNNWESEKLNPVPENDGLDGRLKAFINGL